MKYRIKVWESYYDRNQGFSSDLLETFDDLDSAIDYSKKIFNDNKYACIEVVDKKNKAYFLKDEEWEEYYIGYKTICNVNKEQFNKYIECWENNESLPVNTLLLYYYDEDKQKYFGINDYNDQCTIREYKNKEDLINWLIGKNDNRLYDNQVVHDSNERFRIDFNKGYDLDGFCYKNIRVDYIDTSNILLFCPADSNENYVLDEIIYRNYDKDEIKEYIDDNYKNLIREKQEEYGLC